MTTRTHAPEGAPCWADLWTSDVEGSRHFYGELLGWEPQEPSPEFGGYFMFHRLGAPVAGGMGPMGDMAANDTWKVYFATPDIQRSAHLVEQLGGSAFGPATPVADLGIQAVLADPAGAPFGLWQPGSFQGFPVIAEPGAPSWFELRSPAFDAIQSFYEQVLSLEVRPMAEPAGFRYATLRQAGTEEDLAGLMDGSMDPGGTPGWSIYFDVADVDDAAGRVAALGGAVASEPQSSPYGRMATVRDPAGAEFRLRGPVPTSS